LVVEVFAIFSLGLWIQMGDFVTCRWKWPVCVYGCNSFPKTIPRNFLAFSFRSWLRQGSKSSATVATGSKLGSIDPRSGKLMACWVKSCETTWRFGVESVIRGGPSCFAT